MEEEVKNEVSYAIYQLNDDASLRYYRFEPLKNLEKNGLAVEREHYHEVWKAPLREGVTMDDLFFELNMELPEGYRGHSLSVSDIIVISQDGEERAYYVDRVGFPEVPDFFEEKERAAYALGDRFLALQKAEKGVEYKILDEEQNILKEGVLDATSINEAMIKLEEALKKPVYDENRDIYIHTTEQGNIGQGDQPKLISYDQLMDKVGHGARNRDIVREFREETKKKFHFEGIEGETIESIEANVKDLVSARLAEYGLDAQVLDVIITGSRARGIENPDSDLDIIVSFSGTAEERAIYDILHEDSLFIGDMILDLNPISADRTGTLDAILPREEEYLKIREQEHEFSRKTAEQISEDRQETTSGHYVQKSDDYKPLAKVEELEEENYNQIDNYLSNTVNKEEKRHPMQEKQIQEDEKKAETKRATIKEKIAANKAKLKAERKGAAETKQKTVKIAENAEIKDAFS